MIANRFNWVAVPRAAWVFTNPFKFLLAVARRKAPAELTVRSPCGHITISLRNFESVRTLFSVFCRQDYFTREDEPGVFLDFGSNIGIATAYFLSRNRENVAVCFEPDFANLEYLERNLRAFGARAEIRDRAVSEGAGQVVLYRSIDGKYSSLIPSERATVPQPVEAEAFSGALELATRCTLPAVVKLDVEGMEVPLVKSVDFARYRNVRRLICESMDCARRVSRKHRLEVRNGYVEDLHFID